MRCTFDIAFHDQIRLVDFFDRASFLAYCDCERVQTDGAAVEFVNQRLNNAFVPLIEPVAIDLQHGKRPVGKFSSDFSVGFHLHVIAHPTQKVVCCARRAATARRNFGRARQINFNSKQARAAHDNFLHFLGVVVVEPRRHAET